MTKELQQHRPKQTKQERRRDRREEQKRREVELQRKKTTRRFTILGVLAVLVISVASIAFYAYYTSTRAATSNKLTLDDIACNQNEYDTYHVHSYLSLYVKGQRVPIPANIGITSSCLYWIHTHQEQPDGFIHVEAPQQKNYNLGNFLDLWGEKFPQLQYPLELKQKDGWQVYVNGEKYNGDYHDILLDAHTIITMAYDSPDVKPVTTINWGDK